ncbi:hypothetical protein BN85414300 [Alteracholeplasma palmae J233]|uniref:Uncharacterized protein n=1 Tax=Alteracholeplasma palmae (strain ATCC 49389 / J233) TaxID=1318466 RepID=U4KLZ9_ALTPJ|nr:hypothetical protein [Alteracholeplasma palmae]CCV65007.1 hypothetical protein BN85414300 [Alteracholeplasma palmae J233]
MKKILVAVLIISGVMLFLSLNQINTINGSLDNNAISSCVNREEHAFKEKEEYMKVLSTSEAFKKSGLPEWVETFA